jgi:hypothetical protein
VRTSDFKPFSDADAKRLSREQKQFCDGLSEDSKDSIRRQQRAIFESGRPSINLRIPGMPFLFCPLCGVIYGDGPGYQGGMH